MYIHREGYKICAITALLALIIIGAIINFIEVWNVLWWIVIGIVAVAALFVIRFFRIPRRDLVKNPNQVIAAADGKIVVVEQVYEPEILKCECIQISTFMSPNNIHVNRYPITGKVVYVNYHSGRYFIAKLPKSSVLNERTSVCIETDKGNKILIRQIAGVLARRIVCYATEGEYVEQGQELGFIKFGSRVDVFLPLSSIIHSELEDSVKGGQTILATLQSNF